MSEAEIHYLYDPAVDTDMDWKLRALIGTCFGDPEFRRQRFFHELPQHRWVIFGTGGILAAHLAIHSKIFGSGAGELKAGGVAEVCVHPDYRGRHYVPALLAAAERDLTTWGTEFSVLFGNPKVYGHSGYRVVDNPLRHYDIGKKAWVVESSGWAMVKELGARRWPAGEIDLRGPHF